jgi:amino acid permease
MDFDIHYPTTEDVEQGKFGLWTGYFLAINVTIGAGFLSIPWAFDNAGWLFSLFYHFFMSFQSLFLARQFLECMSRAEVLFRMCEEGRKIQPISLKKLFQQPKMSEKLIQAPHLKPIITRRMINSPDIIKLVFGDKVGMVYMFGLFLYQFGTMVAYGSIFASSFASNVPLGTQNTCDIYNSQGFYNDCRWKYWVFLLIFGVITTYMTIIGVKEQQYVQISMSILRFIVIFSIIIICIVNISLHRNNDNDKYNNLSWPPLVVWENIGHAIPIIYFSASSPIQIPAISEEINNKQRNLPLSNIMMIFSCFVLYSIIGIITPIAISNIPSMATLGFRNFTAGYSRSNRPSWTYFFEYLIIISPALDVFSAFPLQALIIADALLTWKYGGNKETIDKKVLYFTRFLFAFSPIVVSFFVYDLGSILDWTGLAGFPITQFMIPLAHIGLRHSVAGESPYDISINIWVQWGMIFINFCVFLLIIGMSIV